MRITKINNIPKFNQKRIISNPIKQDVQYDILDISFSSKRIRHSKEFLKHTKNNDNLRDFITKTCMIDENGKFSPKREELFCKTYKNLDVKDLSEEDSLILCATAVGGYFNSIKGASIEYCLKTGKNLLEAGFSKEDINNIFNSDFFYTGYSEGLIYLKQVLGDNFNLPDANLFLVRYCLDNKGRTVPQKVSIFAYLFSELSIDNIYQADAIYNLSLNDKKEIDPNKSALISFIGKALLDASSQDTKAKGEVISILTSILSLSTLETGEIDVNKALKIWQDIGEYVIDNEGMLDSILKFPIFNPTTGEAEEITMQQLRKKFPQECVQYDNLFSKFVAMFKNQEGIKS